MLYPEQSVHLLGGVFVIAFVVVNKYVVRLFDFSVRLLTKRALRSRKVEHPDR